MAELWDLVELYLKFLQNKKYAKNTIISYEINLRYFYSFIKSYDLDFRNLKGSNMVSLVDAMQNYKDATINIRLTSLKSFYEFLINIDEVNKNPVRQSLYSRYSRTKPKPLTENQETLFRIFISGKPKHIKVPFIILLETGIRLSELTKLKKENFIKINKKYFIEIIDSKNNNNRIAPISHENYKMVMDYAKEEVYKGNLFNMSNRGYQYHADTFSQQNEFKFSVHSLRHTYATRLGQKGTPIQIIQKLLGHKNIATTMYYLEVTDLDILNLELTS